MPVNKQKNTKSKGPKKGSGSGRAATMNSGLMVSSPAIAPIAMGTSRRAMFGVTSVRNKRFGDAVRVRGQDLLERGTLPPTADTLANNIFLSPQSLDGTRLQLWAAMYEKFLFRKLIFHFDTAAPTTSSGTYLLAYDRDISDPTPAQDLAGTRSLLSMENACEFPVWQSGSITCPLIQPDDGYYTSSGSDERLFTQGQLYIWTSSAPSTGCSYNLWVEYDCEFFVPQLEPSGFYQISGLSSTQTPSLYIGATTDAPYPLLNTLSGGTIAPGSSSGYQLSLSPEATYGYLLKGGSYLIDLVYGNQGGDNTYSASATLSTILAKLIAVDQKEQPKCEVINNLVANASTTGGATGKLKSFSSINLAVPPSGAWLTAALAPGAWGSAALNMACSLIIHKIKGF